MQAPEGNDVSLYPIGIDWRTIDPREYLLRDLNANLYYYEMQAANKLKLFTVMRECACHRENRLDFKYMLMGINIFLMLSLATNNDLVASLILELLDFQHFAILSVFLPFYKRSQIGTRNRFLQRICKPSKLNFIRIQECLVNDAQLYYEYLNLQPLKQNTQIDSIEFTDHEIRSATFNPVFNIIALYTSSGTFYIYKYDTYRNEKCRKVVYFERLTLTYHYIMSWSQNGKYFYLAVIDKENAYVLQFYYYNQYMETFTPIKNNFKLLNVPTYLIIDNLWLSENSIFYYLESEETCYEYSFENDNNYPSQTVLSSSLNQYCPKLNRPVKQLILFKRNLFIVRYGCPHDHRFHVCHYCILQYNLDEPDTNVHYQYVGLGKHLQIAANSHMLVSLSTFRSGFDDDVKLERKPYNSTCRFYNTAIDDYDAGDYEIDALTTIGVTMINAEFQCSAVSRLVR